MFVNRRCNCTSAKQAELEFSSAWEGTGVGGHVKLLAFGM